MPSDHACCDPKTYWMAALCNPETMELPGINRWVRWIVGSSDNCDSKLFGIWPVEPSLLKFRFGDGVLIEAVEAEALNHIHGVQIRLVGDLLDAEVPRSQIPDLNVVETVSIHCNRSKDFQCSITSIELLLVILKLYIMSSFLP